MRKNVSNNHGEGDGNGGVVGGSCSNKTICIFMRKEDGTGINEAYRKYLFKSQI